jgi:hypothetical protein
MTYYPSERWTDKLFGMRAPTVFDEPLQQKENYQRILATALNNKEKNVGTVGFHGQGQNESLFEIAKEHGIVLLTKLSGDLFPSDHIIVVPMGVENGEPQDVWILEMEEETYDGRPISSDLSDTVWRINKLDAPFLRRVDQMLTRFYEKGREGYDAINKRVI